MTDGQEALWVTESAKKYGGPVVERTNILGQRETDPMDPDSDGDGYWDGWIGVYGVGASDNVALYMENLQSGNGIEGEEIVQEQVGVHKVRNKGWSSDRDDRVPSARGADINGDEWLYHSNVHLGELHWGTDPADETSAAYEDTTLRVESDYVKNSSWPSDGDPSAIQNENGISVQTAIATNFRLYGINIVYAQNNEEIYQSSLRDICKGAYQKTTDVYSQSCLDATLPDTKKVYMTPDSFNRNELVRIEDEFHDDDSRIHMLWGTELGNDQPKTPIDTGSDYSGSTGVARHVGSPNSHHVAVIEPNDFGIMVARDSFTPNDFQDLQSVGMHELGHALSIGWHDDTEPPYDLVALAAPKSYEIYSGNLRRPDLAGGLDPMPEMISVNNNRVSEWSIMMAGTAQDSKTFTSTPSDFPVLLFSIEELSTADFKHVPSKEE